MGESVNQPLKAGEPVASDGPVSVLVVDDHPLVREAIGSAVALADDLELVGEAGDGQSALAALDRLKPDVCIIDFALPGMTGLDIVARARAGGSTTRFLLLTGATLDAAERASLSARVEGFAHKEAGSDTLMDAVRKAARAPRLRASTPRIDPDPSAGLTRAGALSERERAVLREIARGHPVDEIAARLEVSPATVRKHRENIMLKLDLNSTAQLVRAAMQIGQF